MSTKKWALLFAGIITLCVILQLVIHYGLNADGGSTAGIYRDGAQLYAVVLSDITETSFYDIYSDDGSVLNTVEISPDGIRMVEASCPDGLCIRQGYLKLPIVCLPNRVVIRFIGADSKEYDAISQ
jgi:hypothetical protein